METLITFPRMIMFISLVGVYYLNWKHNKAGFIFLGISALCWAWYDWGIGAHEQAIMVFGSAVTSIIGYLKWWFDERKGR